MTDAVIAGGVKIANLNFWVKGARAARVPLQRLGEGLSPYPFALVFPQDAHERLLIEQLDALGVRVERQTELLRFEQHDGGVRAALRRLDGSEEICEAAYLAGCDGLHRLSGESSPLAFRGEPIRGCFTSPMWKRRGRRQTMNRTSTSKMPIFCSFFPSREGAAYG